MSFVRLFTVPTHSIFLFATDNSHSFALGWCSEVFSTLSLKSLQPALFCIGVFYTPLAAKGLKRSASIKWRCWLARTILVYGWRCCRKLTHNYSGDGLSVRSYSTSLMARCSVSRQLTQDNKWACPS